MISEIKWNKTSEGLPEPSVYNVGFNKRTNKEILSIVDDDLLVIWDGKVKRSRYLSEDKRWEGHTENEIPEYWVKIKDIEIK